MRTKSNGLRLVSSNCYGWRLLAVAAAVTVASASAAPVTLPNRQDAGNPSSFTLDFGQFGGISTANITSSFISIDIDPAARTARFGNYVQFVDPLTLPGGLSTGNISVVIENPADGHFDPGTGDFRIENVQYAVHFDGDLSAFGIKSPFRLASTAEGRIAFSTASEGSTRMDWRGETALPIPSQPGAFLPFTYTCSVNGAFTLESNLTWVMRSNPPRGAIDARQPHPAKDNQNWQGWNHVDLTFNALPAAAINTVDVIIDEVGGDGYAPNIVSIEQISADTVRVTLDEVVEPGAWIEIAIPGFDAADGTVCLASLPGDVNNDGRANAKDASVLVNAINGRLSRSPLAAHQCDINRDGTCNVSDLAAVADLLNGKGMHEVWRNATLPQSACSE